MFYFDPFRNDNLLLEIKFKLPVFLIVPGLSQSQSITPSTTSSIGKSFSNSSIEQVSASPSFSSHESVRTSSSLLHGGSTPSMETSRIASESMSIASDVFIQWIPQVKTNEQNTTQIMQ